MGEDELDLKIQEYQYKRDAKLFRQQAAMMAMQGLLSGCPEMSLAICARDSVLHADALIAELNRRTMK